MKKILILIVMVLGVFSAMQARDSVNDLTDRNREKIISTAKKMYVIDFTASWCGPCKQFAPIYHQVANDMSSSIDFYRVDVDHNPLICEDYHVRAVPTIVICNPKTGKQKILTGYQSKDAFIQAINSMK